MPAPRKKDEIVALAALVIAKDASGADVYIYQGSAVPEGIPAAEVKRLTDEGFVGTIADEQDDK